MVISTEPSATPSTVNAAEEPAAILAVLLPWISAIPLLLSVAVKSYALLDEPLVALITSVSPTAIWNVCSGLSVEGVIVVVYSSEPPSVTLTSISVDLVAFDSPSEIDSVIVVLPSATPVTLPLLSTVATPVLLLLQVAESTVAFDGVVEYLS